MMLVLPLITGGALATVVKSLGVSLPFGLSSLIGGGSRGRGFDGISGGRGQGLGLDQVVNIAKMFI